MLLIPLITGAAVGLRNGGHGWPLVPLSITVLTLFWLRTPVESWFGAAAVRARSAREFALVRKAVLILSTVAVSALAWLFWGGRNAALLWVGGAAGVAFLGQALVKKNGRTGRVAAQIIGAAGLTATAPAAYYVVTGGFGRTAWSLWISNFLFAANQIQFVQLRIRAARAVTTADKVAAGREFLAAQLLLPVLLAAAAAEGFAGWLAVLAFAPVLVRGFAWFLEEGEPLAIHTLGKQELIYAGVFGVLLAGGMAL